VSHRDAGIKVDDNREPDVLMVRADTLVEYQVYSLMGVVICEQVPISQTLSSKCHSKFPTTRAVDDEPL
jgi:hypothetical protein